MTKVLQIDRASDANIEGVSLFQQNKTATRYAFFGWRLIILTVRKSTRKLPHFAMVGRADKTWFKLGKV